MSTLVRILRAPWLATIRGINGYLMLILWFLLTANLGKLLPIHGLADQFGVAVLLLTVTVAWKLVANTLWLARDATALRLPNIGRDVDAVPWVFALATVLLPSLLLGVAFGHLLLWLVSLALVATAMLALCVLPLVVVLPALIAVATSALFGLHPPLPGTAGYLDWALPTAIVLGLAAAQRWITLRHAVCMPSNGWLRPTTFGGRVVQVRRLRGDNNRSSALGTFHGARKTSRTVLRDVGPAHPVRSLRLTLHSSLQPLSARTTPRQYWIWQAVFAIAVLTPPTAALIAEHQLGRAAVLTFTPQLLLIAAIVLTASSLHDRAADYAWCRPHGDLSLPALLPYLNHPATMHRDTLLACIAINLTTKAWCAFSAALLFAVLHLPAMFYVYLLLTLATGIAMQLVATTNAFVGHKWRLWSGYVVYGSAVVVPLLLTKSWGVRVVGQARPQLYTLGWPAVICVLMWLAWCAAFGAMAWRNWRRFTLKPHPFLANEVA